MKDDPILRYPNTPLGEPVREFGECFDAYKMIRDSFAPAAAPVTEDTRLIESNELHYLRWFHKNAADWVNPNSACQSPAIFVHSMNLAYQDETGRKVPSDYEVPPR
jgi:hypothetical protein